MSKINRLKGREYNGYLRVQLPHKLDDAVTEVVEEYRSQPPSARPVFLDTVSRDIAAVLSAYGQRMAAIAVRTRSMEVLRRAVVAMGMGDAVLEDFRDNLIVLASINHSAEAIGSDLGSLLDDVAAELPEPALRRFRAFEKRSPRDKSLQAMGLTTSGAGPDFKYVSGSTAG